MTVRCMYTILVFISEIKLTTCPSELTDNVLQDDESSSQSDLQVHATTRGVVDTIPFGLLE